VSQFDKDDVEKAGLVKFDFLGLRTLTILAEAVRFVKEVEGVDIDLDTLPLDDKPTYDASSRRPTPRRCSSSNRAA
jgi:DNA polymerase-3 subunit alpha